VLEAQKIISHGVDGAWEVVMGGDAAMVSLVKSLKTEEICGCFCSCGRALHLPPHCSDVVMEVMKGVGADVTMLGSCIVMGDGTH
jgi:hypothetical protein